MCPCMHMNILPYVCVFAILYICLAYIRMYVGVQVRLLYVCTCVHMYILMYVLYVLMYVL